MNDNEIYIDDSVPLVRVEDMSYPMYFSDVRTANTNMSFPYPIRMDILATVGYAPVFTTDKPEGDVVTNGVPEQREDGRWYQTWVIRDYTPEEAKEILDGKKYFSNFNAQEVLRLDREIGVPYTRGGKTYTISLREPDLSGLFAVQNHTTLVAGNVKYFTKEGIMLDFTVDEFAEFYDFVLEAFYKLINSYWSFLSEVSTITDLKLYPEEPTTFNK